VLKILLYYTHASINLVTTGGTVGMVGLLGRWDSWDGGTDGTGPCERDYLR